MLRQLRRFWARNERARKRNEVLVEALTTALLVNYYHQVNIPGVIESGLKIYSVSSVLPPGPSQLLGFSVYGSLAGFLQLKGELDRVTKICLEMGEQMGDVPSLGRAMYYCGFGYRIRTRCGKTRVAVDFHETRVLSAHPGLLQGSARHGGSRDQPLRIAQRIVSAAVVAHLPFDQDCG